MTFAQLLEQRDGVPYTDAHGRDLTTLTGYAREYGERYHTEQVLAKRRAAAERAAWWQDNQEDLNA